MIYRRAFRSLNDVLSITMKIYKNFQKGDRHFRTNWRTVQVYPSHNFKEATRISTKYGDRIWVWKWSSWVAQCHPTYSATSRKGRYNKYRKNASSLFI